MSTSLNTIAGKHAFVTGASRGIGAAIAAELEKAGALVTRIAHHAHDNVCACDVSSAEQVSAAMTQAERQYGPIQLLINNAGIGASKKFLAADTAMLDSMLDVNLKGAWHCSQRALPGMLATNWGRIVNVASLAGLEGFPYISAYCVSKHALIGLTRALAAEFAGKGIAIAAVCPGYTDTDILASTIANITTHTGLSNEQARAKVAALNPGGRILSSTEVAAAVLALCSTDSDNSNGQIISIPS